MSETRIDKSTEFDALKKKYGRRYFDNPQARKKASEIWGVECNDSGVVLNRQEEILVHIGQCKAEISFIETRNGHVLFGLNVVTAIGGYGYAPSVWDQIGFASYWDARLFAVEKFIDYFEKEAITTNSCSSNANKQNAKKAAEILRGELTPQLDLF